VRQRHRNATVGEHGALTVWLNDHDDGGAASITLKERLHASGEQCRLECIASCIAADRANEASPSASGCGGDGNIRCAPATSSADLCRCVASASPGCREANGDLINQVADADD
jgi:hypothetical protein